jgi:hypothetical protein
VKAVARSKTTMNYSRIFNFSRTFTTSQNQNSFQQQMTAINIDTNGLKSPHILSIRATANTDLSGQVAVNGATIKRLQSNQISFNLSPFISQGINQVEISGNYKPLTSSINIEFYGSSTKIYQQVSGNGTLRQTLMINVC